MTRDPVNAFASCPAATGEASCPQFPDGAHRCGRDRGHVRYEAVKVAERIAHRIAHRCTCGNIWTSLSGTLTNQMVIPDHSTYIHISPADDMRVALDEVRRKRS